MFSLMEEVSIKVFQQPKNLKPIRTNSKLYSFHAKWMLMMVESRQVGPLAATGSRFRKCISIWRRGRNVMKIVTMQKQKRSVSVRGPRLLDMTDRPVNTHCESPICLLSTRIPNDNTVAGAPLRRHALSIRQIQGMRNCLPVMTFHCMSCVLNKLSIWIKIKLLLAFQFATRLPSSIRALSFTLQSIWRHVKQPGSKVGFNRLANCRFIYI